jgi:shikimate dehydrogenase
MEQRIKGTTGLLGLIGSPVGHSGSPAMYNFSFQYHNLDYAYMAFDIKEDQVPAALDAMRLFKMRGCNVTMPCKNEVAKHMDELSPAARIIGAVNTIVNEDGKLIGHITDGIGFVRNLKENGEEVKGKKLVVLGAGGAATAIQVQCALDGAKAISIFNPDDPFLARAHSTAEKLKKEVPECEVNVYCLDDQDKLKEEIASADILVNATLAGMKPHDDLTLITDKSVFRSDLVVADVVYNPAETRLIKEAKEAGCKKAIGGSGMLLWQGAAAYQLYTGLEMPTAEYQQFQKEQAEK